MKRIIWTCSLLIALTLVPTTGAVVALASSPPPVSQGGEVSTPSGSASGGDAVCDVNGDPDDIIDGNRRNNGTIDLGDSGNNGCPLSEDDLQGLCLLLMVPPGLP
jgi:hypothetical protein